MKHAKQERFLNYKPLDRNELHEPSKAPPGQMTSAEIQRQIDVLEQRATDLGKKMDEAIQQCADELVNASRTFIDAEMRRKIDEHASTIQAMSPEKVSALKARVSHLKDALPRQVASELKDATKWPHREQLERPSYSEDYFSRTVRKLTSELGSVLNDYGILRLRNDQYPSWKPAATGRFEYSISLGFEPSKSAPIKKYNELYQSLAEIRTEIAIKREEFAKAKAKEMWDSA